VERVKTARNLENLALGRTSAKHFIHSLSAEEFDILWDLTDRELTLGQIAKRNGFSVSQVQTIRTSLARKAEANLK